MTDEPTDATAGRDANAGVQWLGPAGQRLLFGAYAWFVTVAPVLAATGVATAPGVCALLAPVPLVAAVFLESRVRPTVGSSAKREVGAGRFFELLVQNAPLAFLAFSLVAWLTGPTRPFERVDRSGGVASVAAWFLFAFISAGPSYPRPTKLSDGAPHEGRIALLRRRAPLFVLLAVVLVSLYALGGSFAAEGAERRTLIALEAVGAGLVLVGGASAIFTDGDRSIRRPWGSLLVALAIGAASIVFLVARRRI